MVFGYYGKWNDNIKEKSIDGIKSLFRGIGLLLIIILAIIYLLIVTIYYTIKDSVKENKKRGK